MIKVYELCILFLFLFFFIYHNYFAKTIIDIYGCTEISALNYNDLATINDGTCSYSSDETDCYSDCTINSDPCLCIKNKDKSSECALNNRSSYKFPTIEL